ncbi:RNA-binding protein [bacterium]|nr:RNA-binding protein [bacterium]
MNIYVSNLSYRVEENQLRSLFEQYGEVSSVKIVMDRETGRSRGFGFVEMTNDAEGKLAIEQLNEVDFQGRNLRVNEARPREEGGGGGFNRGGGGGGYNRGGGYGGGGGGYERRNDRY